MKHPFSQPESSCLVLFLVLLLGMTARAEVREIAVHGKTRSGLSFAGKLSASDAGKVMIRTDRNGLLGLPLAEIDFLEIDHGKSAEMPASLELQILRPLLPCLGPASLSFLHERLERALSETAWESVHHWSVALIEALPDNGAETPFRLLKAQALWKMGLLERLDAELVRLNERFPPMEAPIELCRLNALIEKRKANWEEVRFWARLAFLRIPLPPGDIQPQLQELANLANARLENHYY